MVRARLENAKRTSGHWLRHGKAEGLPCDDLLGVVGPAGAFAQKPTVMNAF